jgi:hypothetical protein
MKIIQAKKATFGRNPTDHGLGNSRLERLLGKQRTQSKEPIDIAET